MEFRSKVKNRVLSGQSREIISSVLKFMKEEAELGSALIPLSKVQERVARATGVSVRTIKTIAHEAKAIYDGERSVFTTPNKKRKIVHTKVSLHDFDRDILRRIIINFHLTEKKTPSLARIHKTFCSDTGYTGSKESLRKEVRRIGFRWRKCKTNRKLLIEKHDIRQLRINYLRNIKKFREENRPIIYMDETYIHSSHTNNKSWNDNTNDGLLARNSKGPRLIIVHAGGNDGFVNGAYVSWKSNIKTGDYHQEMNFDNYKKWLEEKLIPNLPPRSILVIDNAPYHNKQIDKCPSSTCRKEEMQKWLRDKNIPFQDTQLKTDLYTLIKMSKPAYVQYEIDAILRKKGHDILRLPPYHPELNPIELVWASLKQYVAERNVTFNMTEVQKLCDEFCQSFTAEDWKKRVEHAIKIENEFRAQEPVIDTIIDDIVFSVGTGDSDFSDELSSDTDEESELSGVEELM